MTAGAHDAGGGFGRSAGANAARGIMVIVAAVVVGLLLMSRGLSDRGGEADAAASSTTATTAETEPAVSESSTTTQTVMEETTTPLEPARDPSEVAVLVLNGTDGLKGVAGRGTEKLKESNYVTRDPKNADVVGPSVILFTDGFEAEAIAVAEVYGVSPDAVVKPFDPATSPIADTQDADIIVRIGNDGVIQV